MEKRSSKMTSITMPHALAKLDSRGDSMRHLKQYHGAGSPVYSAVPAPVAHHRPVALQSPSPMQHGYYYYPQTYQAYPHNSNVQILKYDPQAHIPHAQKRSKQSFSWSPREDKLLRELKEVQKLGWREISTFFNDRTPNACQFRWRRIISGTATTKPSSTAPSPTPAHDSHAHQHTNSSSTSGSKPRKKSPYSIKFLLN